MRGDRAQSNALLRETVAAQFNRQVGRRPRHGLLDAASNLPLLQEDSRDDVDVRSHLDGRLFPKRERQEDDDSDGGLIDAYQSNANARDWRWY